MSNSSIEGPSDRSIFAHLLLFPSQSEPDFAEKTIDKILENAGRLLRFGFESHAINFFYSGEK